MEPPQQFWGEIKRDELKNGCLFSTEIERSSIWPTIAKLPVVHPYTNYIPPCSVIALKCFVPEDYKTIASEAFFHVQTLPDPDQEQLIRVHPYTHPQNIQINHSHQLPVKVILYPFPGHDKPYFAYNLNGHVHPGGDQNHHYKTLVASPNDGNLTLDWKNLQRFIGLYTANNKTIVVLHATVCENLGSQVMPCLETSEDPIKHLLNLSLEDPELQKNLTFIQEAYNMFW